MLVCSHLNRDLNMFSHCFESMPSIKYLQKKTLGCSGEKIILLPTWRALSLRQRGLGLKRFSRHTVPPSLSDHSWDLTQWDLTLVSISKIKQSFQAIIRTPRLSSAEELRHSRQLWAKLMPSQKHKSLSLPLLARGRGKRNLFSYSTCQEAKYCWSYVDV